MRRRGRLIAVAVGVALATAACGSGDGGSTGGGGSASGPITLGLLAPLTGATAQTAKIAQNMAELAAAEINAAGGVNGRDIQIKTYDTQLKPETATQQAQRAITQDKVTAIVGPYSSSEALAVAALTERSKVVNVNYSASTPTITAGKKFVFRTSPLTTDLSRGLVDVAQALGAKNAAFLYDSGGFGLGAKAPVEDAAKAKGLALTASVQYTVSATDVSAEVTKAAQGKPDVVIIAGSAGADQGLVAKAMVEQGLNVPYIGLSPIVTPDAVKIAGAAYTSLPGVYTLQCADVTKPAYTKVLAAYNAKYDKLENASEQPLQAYDAVYMLADALKKTSGAGGEPLAQALEQLPARDGASGLAGSTLQFSATKHDAHTGQYLVPYKLEGAKPVQATDLKLTS
jgi:branched-chain amino acid transport system substrate-binding protein